MADDPAGPRRTRLLKYGIVAVVTAWLLVVGFEGVRALLNIDRGVRAVDAAQADLKGSDLTKPVALARLDAVRSDFSGADSDLHNPALVPIRWVPVLGRQLRAVQAMAHAASGLAAVGRSALAQAQGAIKAPRATGAQRLAAVRSLADAADVADTALQRVDLGPRVGLLGIVRSKHNEFASKLARIQQGVHRAALSAQAAATLLTGDHVVLLLAANNGEMRNGSGTFLSASTMAISDGALKVSSFRDTADLEVPAGAVAATPALVGPWGFLTPNQEWRNLGLTARFDATAALAAEMWKSDTGQAVTDVMGVDVAAFQLLVQASGTVEANGRTYDGASVVSYLLHDQYVGIPSTLPADSASRRDALGAIAQTVMGSLQLGHFDTATLAQHLSQVVGGRHLMLWSSDPALEGLWNTVGAGGQVEGDALLVALQNRGANKLDQYVTVTSQLAIQPGAPSPGRTRVMVSVHVRNDAPPDSPPYIAGTGQVAGLAPDEYEGYVTVTMPGSAQDVIVNGQPTPEVLGPDGATQVVAVVRRIAPGVSIDVAVTFTLPVGHGHMRIDSAARVPSATMELEGPHPSGPIADDRRPTIVW